MAQVALRFNNRTYRFQCGEEEVERVERLAKYLKTKLEALMIEHGPIGDERIVLMAALTLADELFEARADIDDLLDDDDLIDDQTGKLKSVIDEVEADTPDQPAAQISGEAFHKASR